jgi:hypothetical protein
VRSLNFGIVNTFLYDLNNFKLNLLIIILASLFMFTFYVKWYLLVSTLILFYLYTNSLMAILNNFFTGFYKIHPPLLYYTLIIFVFYKFIKKKVVKYSILFLIKIFIITFCLGSLWALTQFIWGKYWSNDSIEIVLILFVFLCLTHIHKFYKTCVVLRNFFLFNLIFLLFLLRLNLIFTKHNFFQKIINLRIYFSLIYFIYASYIFLRRLKDINKLVLTLKNYSFLFYIFLIEIFCNYLNMFFVKKINLFLLKLCFSFLVCYLLTIHSMYLVHWFIYSGLLIFSLFSLTHFKYFVNFRLTVMINYTSYFLIKKQYNFWIFKKLQIFWKFYLLESPYIKDKNFSNFQFFKNTNVALINFL